MWVEGIGAYKTNSSEHLVIDAKGNSVEVVRLCQYTGLKDKNGKKIFEGDVIQDDVSKYKHLIRYDEKCAAFCAQILPKVKYSSGICLVTRHWIDEFGKVVIGNIYDNPKLLNSTDPTNG